MKRTPLIGALIAAGVLLAAGGYILGRATSRAPDIPALTAVATAASSASVAGQPRVLYWHDPMVPGQRFDNPGKSPFMDMPLVPVYAEDTADSGVRVSSTVQQNLGIRTASVRRAEVTSTFDAVGSVQFDERLNVAVQTRVAGYVERLFVRAPMERVRKGQALAIVFAPEWLGPLNELAALERAGVSADLLAAARDRTRAMSIPSELVRQVEDGATPTARFVVSAPSGGVIAELGVREGVAVPPGATMFRIAGLEKVWAVGEIPETQAGHLASGQAVKASLQADPSQVFDGKLAEILPEISATTRTLKARFEVDNRSGRLVPGMLLRLQVAGPKVARLLVPTEAIIRTGRRALVLVRQDHGAFESRDVVLGQEFGEDTEVSQGLAEGEQVVASGQFLIDSEARLRSVTGAMAVPAMPPAPIGSMPAPGAGSGGSK